MNARNDELLAEKNSIELAIINKKFILESRNTCNTKKVTTGAAIASHRIRLSELEKELIKQG